MHTLTKTQNQQNKHTDTHTALTRTYSLKNRSLACLQTDTQTGRQTNKHASGMHALAHTGREYMRAATYTAITSHHIDNTLK